MKINNENEKYTLQFIVHTNILHIKSSRNHVMKNNVNITYQAMGRQKIKTHHHTINVRLTVHEMIIYETIHIPTRGE